MRIDVLSIFPDYLRPLDLSLPGRAQEAGLLDLRVHDLRAWTHDRHRTVDDTPYGGGAGMVMKPEPWGEALDEVAPGATIVFTTPGGEPFTQALARELSGAGHLVLACGRYEGIDQRVVDHASTLGPVREVSLGDYVLNGGEVAALAITEAVVRLLPGFMGNAASLVEESHTASDAGASLLEYPVYTKPAVWRDRPVPDVLLSGDHGRIAAWRHEQRVLRTAERRPDLLAPASVPGGGELVAAVPSDAGELLTLQRACWVAEQQANPDVRIHALHESLEDVRAWLGEWTVQVLRRDGRLVGAYRARLTDGGAWDVGRLMVAPDLQGQGLGRWLLEQAEAAAPAGTGEVELFTGAGSTENIRMYRRAGYRPAGTPERGVVRLAKRISR